MFICRNDEFRKKASISFGIQFDNDKYGLLEEYLGEIIKHKDLVSYWFQLCSVFLMNTIKNHCYFESISKTIISTEPIMSVVVNLAFLIVNFLIFLSRLAKRASPCYHTRFCEFVALHYFCAKENSAFINSCWLCNCEFKRVEQSHLYLHICFLKFFLMFKYKTNRSNFC